MPLRVWMLLLIVVMAHATTDEARAEAAFGVTTSNVLIAFNTAMPALVVQSVPITGLQGGENIVGIDFRPSNGQLYGLGSTGRLYTINTVTGAATQAGAGTFALSGTDFGFDFNPVVDRIRVVSDADQNFRLNPDTGAVAGIDTSLAYAPADPNFGANPNVVAAAYTNNIGGALSTTLYGIDSSLDRVVRIGGPDGTPSPNGGQLTTIGATGVDTSGLTGFDIASNGTALGTFTPLAGSSSLYTINLSTGAATLVGLVGDGIGTLALRDMTVRPESCGGCPAHTIHGHLPGPATHSGSTHEHHGQHGHTSAAACPPHAPGHSVGLQGEEPQVLAAVTADGAISDNGPARDLPGAKVRPAQRGEILRLFVVAELDNETPVVRIAEAVAEVLSSDPALGGVWQLAVRVPQDVTRGVPLHVTVRARGLEWSSIDIIVE